MKKIFIGLLVVFVFIGGFGLFLMNKRGSSKTSEKYNDFSFISEDKDIDKEDFTRNDGMFYLSLDYIKEYLDEDAHYDKAEKTIVLVNDKGTKRIPLNSKQMDLNGQTIELRQAAYEKGDKIYLPIEAFIYDYPVELRYIKDKNLLVLDRKDFIYSKGISTGDGLNMREKANTSSPLVAILNDKDEVYVYGEKGDFYRVRQIDGYMGYIRKDLLDVDYPEDKFKIEKTQDIDKKEAASKPLNLTWDYTYSRQSDESVEQIVNVPGLDVICPTWFSIGNVDADVIDRGNMNYVNKYNELGIDVWAYLDNSFDPDITHEVLKSSAKREKVINSCRALIKQYGLKGINIDFEHTKIDDRDNITQFVREINGVLKQDDIVVSVAVTPQISSNVKKEPYDRYELSKVADYIMVMAYDQHWASSDKAGSVAEYSWVEGNINNLFSSIPKEKFILCIPFYSRLWAESSGDLKSQSLSMEQVNNLIVKYSLNPKWDEEIKQSIAEYSNDGKDYKLWIENSKSIEYKTKLVNKYNLAGIASWRKGFETPEIWTSINNNLYQK